MPGYALRWISPAAGYYASVALTGFCVAATLFFALSTNLESFVIGFGSLSVIVGGGAVYAWWDWKHPAQGPNRPIH